jgi:uncharacterized protein YbaP (TraB family)
MIFFLRVFLALALQGLFLVEAAASVGLTKNIPYWVADRGSKSIILIGEQHRTNFGITSISAPLRRHLSARIHLGLEVSPSEKLKRGEALKKVLNGPVHFYLDDAVWKRIEKEFPPSEPFYIPLSSGVREGRLSDLKKVPAWAAANVLEMNLIHKYSQFRQFKSGNFNVANNLTWFEIISKASKYETIASLETVEEFLKFQQVCASKESSENLLLGLIEQWKSSQYDHLVFISVPVLVANGDVHELHKKMTVWPGPKIEDGCLTLNRNKLWIEKLLQWSEKYPVQVFVVGALHLGGDNGLLSLLKKNGFLIKKGE